MCKRSKEKKKKERSKEEEKYNIYTKRSNIDFRLIQNVEQKNEKIKMK